MNKKSKERDGTDLGSREAKESMRIHGETTQRHLSLSSVAAPPSPSARRRRGGVAGRSSFPPRGAADRLRRVSPPPSGAAPEQRSAGEEESLGGAKQHSAGEAESARAKSSPFPRAVKRIVAWVKTSCCHRIRIH